MNSDNQQAARELPSVRDIPDGELVRRAIGNIRPSKYRVLWGLVAERFALGSNYACDLCRIHGFNPEARKPSEMRAAPPRPTQERSDEG